MKFTKSVVVALSFSAAMMVGVVPAAFAQQGPPLTDKVYVCYYDKDTYEFKYCQWE